MTCAQGLLRLLWGGGPEVGVLRDCELLLFILVDQDTHITPLFLCLGSSDLEIGKVFQKITTLTKNTLVNTDDLI